MTRFAYMVQDRLAGIIQWWRDWSFGLKGARAEWDSYRQLASEQRRQAFREISEAWDACAAEMPPYRRPNPMPRQAPNGFAIYENERGE